MTTPGSAPQLTVLVFGASLRARFDKNLQAFLSLAVKQYPGSKRAWVEFLGEPPGAAADRVDPPPA